MKNNTLRTIVLLGLTAGLYALSVAFTTGTDIRVSPAIDRTEEEKSYASIDHWVATKLGYPQLLEGSEADVVVRLKLNVTPAGEVVVVQCQSTVPELEQYIQKRIQGEQAQLEPTSYGRSYELKINFRHL